MRPYTKTVIELFDGKKRYLIPRYQRQYAWKVSPQLELLWADITRVATLMMKSDIPAPHFMGAMVIKLITTYGKQVQAFEVIDGQQRLTTFQILLAAFFYVTNEHAPDYSKEILNYLLNNGIMETPEIEKYKVWPSFVDREAFKYIVNPAEEIIPKSDNPNASPAILAYEFFKERILEFIKPEPNFDQFKMEKLFEALKKGLAIVSIELEGGDDPQTIFETLNSRGVDLTVGDLLRNFIFQRAVGSGQKDGSLIVDQLYEKYWLPLDNWFWRELVTRGRLSRPSLHWMIADHLTMKSGEIATDEKLYESYRNWIVQKNPFPSVEFELKSLTKSAKIFRKLTEGIELDVIGRLGRFTRAFDVSTANPLIIYLTTECDLKENLEKALRSIESFIIRRDICGLPTGGYNRFFVDLINKLRLSADEKYVLLIDLLKNGDVDTTIWPNDAKFSDAWINRGQYKSNRQPRLKYILEILEENKRTEESEVVNIKSDLTLEHIMPQRWTINWPLSEKEAAEVDPLGFPIGEQKRNLLVQTIGNLTLLTQKLNSQISNGPFNEKMPALRAQTALILNRELYNFDTWNEDTIKARGAHLLKAAISIWPGPPLPS